MAVNDPTTNYGFNIPNDLSDDGTWGAILREILGEGSTSTYAPNGGVDKILKAISDVADAALARAGGSMTGEIDVLTARYFGGNLGNMTGTVTLDLDTANAFWGTVTGPVTFAFSNVPASGDAVFVTLEVINGGSQVLTWPASVTWVGGSAPTFTTSGTDIVTLYTRDGGTKWRAAMAMRALST
jgi:hypothetical protein